VSDPKEVIHSADRMARLTGESYAVVFAGGAFQAWPLLNCIGMDLLEVVTPPDEDTANWIKSQQIRWAKGKKKAETG